MKSAKERLASLLRRGRQPSSEEEKARIEQELREVAAQGGPPRNRAEMRPVPRGEKRA